MLKLKRTIIATNFKSVVLQLTESWVHFSVSDVLELIRTKTFVFICQTQGKINHFVIKVPRFLNKPRNAIISH